jgi:hypothetical protein
MKVIFFAPHSAIWVHAFPEALVAEALAQAGHQIVYVSCGEQFRGHCVSMSAQGVKPDSSADAKQRVCDACRANEGLIREQFGFGGYTLASVLDDEDRAEVERRVLAATATNFLELVIDGVEVGRAALGTFLLSYKKSSLEFDKETWEIFSIELRNTLYSFYGARKILRTERPDRLVLYSSGYSVNLVFCHVAESMGIAHYYMNAGSNITDRLQKVVLARGHSLQKRLLGHWPEYRERPCPPAIMRYVTDHFLEVLKGRSAFVYSAGRSGDATDIRGRFGIRADQRILLATLSSLDELFAAEVTGLFPRDYRTPFPNQVAWMNALLPWVAARDDLFLIVRVHPREFPNKRDAVKSDHARQLETALRDLPGNVAVNWPSDNLSLYDLAEETAVCLNAWSTVGKEMTLLGIPTVIYSPDLVFYPEDLNFVGTTVAEYLGAIESALDAGWNVDRSRLTYRWLALEDQYSRLDISDGFRRSEYAQSSIAGRILARARRGFNPRWREEADCRNRPALLKVAGLIVGILVEGGDSVLDLRTADNVGDSSTTDEDAGLRSELRRLAASLYDDFSHPGKPGSLKANLQNFLTN